jgi:dipeptidyl aminopeptidase/acylaminoacyl peptidase
MTYVRDPRGGGPRGSGPRRPGGRRTPDRGPAGQDRGEVPPQGRSGSLRSLPLAALLSVVGLLAVAVVSLDLLRGAVPFIGGGGGGDGGPIHTPTPSNVVVIDPRAEVPGTLAYVKGGNLWVQRGATATQLTSSGGDSAPSFSPDGTYLYFIRSTPETGRWRVNGVLRRYDMQTPALMRVRVDGSTDPETLFVGRYTSGQLIWQTFLRQPRVSPDGAKVAVITDGPDPTRSDTVLKFWDPATKKLSDPKISEITPLGHQDPAWAPDGASILVVKDARDGTRGAPVILRYDLTTKKATAITGPGYLQPSWSPDGRFIAATRTTSLGTDVAILDAASGAEMLRLTNDDSSFAPVWSPAGDAIVFLRVSGGVVDLWLARLAGTPGTWVVEETLAMTVSAGLDGASGAAWFIPADQLPTPAPTDAPPTDASAAPQPS